MYLMLCLDYKHAHIHMTVLNILTGGSHLSSHWVHPPQRCALPCPGCCCRGKVCGQAAGRTSWGKCSATTQKKPFSVISPSLRDSKEDLWCLYSHQHMEGRKQVVHREVRKTKVGWFLGAQYSGKWQQLGHSDTQDATEYYWDFKDCKIILPSQKKKIYKGLSFSVYFLFTFLQQCLVLLCTAAPTGPEKNSRWEQLLGFTLTVRSSKDHLCH